MTQLIAYVPGISSHTDSWNPLIDKLRANPELRGAHWLPINHRCGWTSKARFDVFAGDVEARIAAEVRCHREIDEIILAGHSFGGQLIRKAFMLAACRRDESSESPSRWDTRVKRIILLASINRGIDPRRSPRMRLGLVVMRCVYPIFGRTIIFDLLPGSTAVVTLRLEWMRYFAELPNPPLIVQLLGSNDSEVSREDLEDTEQFPNARHLTVPGADHIHLYDLNSTCEPDVHYALIRDAFVSQDPPGEPKSPKLPVSKVVFLLHGIRATAHGWPRQLETEIKRQDATVTVVRPSTGYFTALRFAVPALHRRALRWFQDEYGQLVASYPTAEFNFVGHSNGTYLMGQTLKRIPSVNFNRVFLGGCVLPQDYPWRQRFQTGQVAQVVNAFTGTDSVVGLLCNALRGLGRKDVGTAGYESFTQAAAGLSDYQAAGRGHGAAFNSPSKLERIAQFVLGGPVPPSTDRLSKPFPRSIVQAAKFSSVAIGAFLLLIFLKFSWFIGLIIVISAILLIAFFLSII